MSHIVELSKEQKSEELEPLSLEEACKANSTTGQKISFKFARKLFQLRHSSGGISFEEAYPGADHKELIKVENSKGLVLSNEEYKTAWILTTSTGKLEQLGHNRHIEQGEIVILNVLKDAQNKRSKVDGRLDKTNMRIRFIEHVPDQIKGSTNITGAILNIHNINSNPIGGDSIGAESAKYSAIIHHNRAHPEKQQLFISYDPPGYGISGAAKIEMTQNDGHRLEEIMIAAMNLMAIYTSSKAREVSSEEDIGLSIHAHSISAGIATTLVADVFEGKKRSYCGVFIPGRNLLNLKSISLESPYANFQPYASFHEASQDTLNGLFRKSLYNKFGLPQIDTVKKMKMLLMNSPTGFKVDIIQPRALVGSENMIEHRYAEQVAAAAISGIQNNEHYNKDEKEGAVTFYSVNEATHNDTTQKLEIEDESKADKKIQSHSKLAKVSYNFFDGLKKATADILGDGSIITALLEKARLYDGEGLNLHSIYDERIKRIINHEGYIQENHSTNRSPGGKITESEKILNLYSHEAILLSRLYRKDKSDIVIPNYYKIYQDFAQKIKGNIDKILSKQKPKEPVKKSKRFMKGKK